MDKKIQIYGKDELVGLLKSKHETCSHLISIGNPKSSLMLKENTFIPFIFRMSFKKILRFNFFDVVDKSELGNLFLIKRIPEQKDVKKMIDFFRKTHEEADGYTFHCTQGVSRSAAMALGVLYMIYRDEKTAVKKLLEIRPVAKPHRNIIRYFDSELGSNLAAENEDIHNK